MASLAQLAVTSQDFAWRWEVADGRASDGSEKEERESVHCVRHNNYSPVLSTKPMQSGIWRWRLQVTGSWASFGVCTGDVPRNTWIGAFGPSRQACFFVTTNRSISEQVSDKEHCRYLRFYQQDGHSARIHVLETTSLLVDLTLDTDAKTLVVELFGAHDPEVKNSRADEVVQTEVFEHLPSEPLYALFGGNGQETSVTLISVSAPVYVKSALKT